MKVIIIGGVAGGASAAARLRRLDENAEITIYEKSGYVSYANCGLPYYIGGIIEDKEELTLQTPESFKNRFNIDVKVLHEVIRIDPLNKEVTVKNLSDNTEFKDSYDKLLISVGAKPIKPKLEGIDSQKILVLRTVEDTFKIKEAVSKDNIESVTVVGGGFIGVETAENLRHLNKQVTIVDKAPQILGQIDEDMASFVEKEMKDNGVELMLSAGVEGFKEEDNKIITYLDNSKTLKSDLVILAIGVVPDSTLAREAGLKLGFKNAIVTDEHMRTSDPDIYACGDAVQILNRVSGTYTNIALAGPANKQGRIVADNMAGIGSVYKGALGSSVLKVFDLTVASTGLNERLTKMNNMEYEKIIISPASHASYYPGGSAMTLKLLFKKDDHKIIGAQIVGKDGVDKRIDVLSTAIYAGIKANDLKDIDLAYAPPYSSAKDPVNMAGFVAENVINGIVKHFFVEDIDSLTERDDVILLDTRTKEEYSRGHAAGFELNIPVDELRDNLNKLDKSKKIYIMCQSGLRSYVASRILDNLGYDVYNFAGGYRYYSSVRHAQYEKGARTDCGIY